MRFKKGSKVEVLNRREVPSGSWCCAEIVSDNGHSYDVKFDCCSEETCATVGRVPRKLVRPCPPSVVQPRCCVPGDIVEVFENNSWKLAQVLRVVGGSYFFVRILGSSKELRAHISGVRMRQVWEDGEWVVIQKESGGPLSGITRNHSQMLPSGADVKRDHSFPLGSKMRRPSLCSPESETCTRACKKMKSVGKTERGYKILETLPSNLLEKVDAVASSQTIHGANFMHAPLNYRTSGYHEMEMDGQNLDADAGYNLVRCSESSDAKSTISSVGSCDSPDRLLSCSLSSQSHDTESQYDDTASSSGSGRESSLPTEEGLPKETHLVELNAYRSTLLALYASGSLSWEQEILLTNLRIMLHISNDEHLFEGQSWRLLIVAT